MQSYKWAPESWQEDLNAGGSDGVREEWRVLSTRGKSSQPASGEKKEEGVKGVSSRGLTGPHLKDVRGLEMGKGYVVK